LPYWFVYRNSRRPFASHGVAAIAMAAIGITPPWTSSGCSIPNASKRRNESRGTIRAIFESRTTTRFRPSKIWRSVLSLSIVPL
jgi:hypothetical protein